MANPRYSHKRGDTFSMAGTVTLPQGNWTGICQVRTARHQLIETLTVTLTPPTEPPVSGNWTYGILIEGDAAQAADWPIDRLFSDVRFIDDSVPPVVRTFPSDGPFEIDVVKEQSSAE